MRPASYPLLYSARMRAMWPGITSVIAAFALGGIVYALFHRRLVPRQAWLLMTVPVGLAFGAHMGAALSHPRAFDIVSACFWGVILGFISALAAYLNLVD